MTRPADPGRRALLTGALVVEAAPTAPEAEAPLGPPPPWLADRISPETCGRCDQPCVAACPEEIIRLHPADRARAGVAWLDFETGPCTLCRACVEACPEQPPELTGRGLPAVVLDHEACLASRGVVCVICVARCPERAFAALPGGRVDLRSEACTGCGACVPACPTDALAIPTAG